MLNTTTGELRPGRCRATNLCPYCARLFAVETSEMLLLDAMEDAPTIYVVLTAREHLTRAECYSHLQQLRRSLRKRWPNVRWALLVEFQKRGALHLNLLLKGVPITEIRDLHEAAAGLWCSRVDATMEAQWTGVIADELGVVKYVTLHFMKQSQAPAIGWRGHRYSSTRDYLVRPAAVMRKEARQALQAKRLLWKIAGQVPGVDAVTLDELVALELKAGREKEWKLWRDPAKPVPGHRRWRDTGRQIVNGGRLA